MSSMSDRDFVDTNILTYAQISFWDALIVQAAHASGAEILYSEDLSDGQRYGAVQVINPFLPGA